MILFLVVLIGGALYLQSRMANDALRNVEVELLTGQYLAEPEEFVEISVILRNRSRIPVFYLRTAVNFPEEAVLEGQREREEQSWVKGRRSVFSCFLMPGQQLERKIRVSFPERGYWPVGGVALAAGDFLGIREEYETKACYLRIAVFPQKTEIPADPAVAGGLTGDRSVRRWIHPDPMLSAGYIDYTGREPQRDIAWKKSSTSGKLMVRRYDYTAEEKVRILLLLEETEPSVMEQCFRLVRTACEEMERRGIPFSFSGNGDLFSMLGRLDRVESGLGRPHRNRIYEGLARATYRIRMPMEDVIRREVRSGSMEETCLLVVPRINSRVKGAAAELQRRTGASVILWQGERL